MLLKSLVQITVAPEVEPVMLKLVLKCEVPEKLSSYLPQAGLLEIPQGKGLSRGIILQQSMKQNWNLQ